MHVHLEKQVPMPSAYQQTASRRGRQLGVGSCAAPGAPLAAAPGAVGRAHPVAPARAPRKPTRALRCGQATAPPDAAIRFAPAAGDGSKEWDTAGRRGSPEQGRTPGAAGAAALSIWCDSGQRGEELERQGYNCHFAWLSDYSFLKWLVEKPLFSVSIS